MESQRVGHDWATFTFTFLGNYASQKIRYMYRCFFNFQNRKFWKKGKFLKRRKNGQKMWVCHSMYPTRFILIFFFFFFASNSFSSLWFTVDSQVSKLGSLSAAATLSSNTNPIKPTSAKALFSTQRAPARVHQIWEESPSSWGLIHRDLHWFGHSEKQNLRQQSIYISPFFSFFTAHKQVFKICLCHKLDFRTPWTMWTVFKMWSHKWKFMDSIFSHLCFPSICIP